MPPPPLAAVESRHPGLGEEPVLWAPAPSGFLSNLTAEEIQVRTFTLRVSSWEADDATPAGPHPESDCGRPWAGLQDQPSSDRQAR